MIDYIEETKLNDTSRAIPRAVMSIKYHLDERAISVGCKFDPPRKGDAGYDIYASENVTIPPRSFAWISTGLYVEIPSTGLYPRVGLIRDRSSVAGSGLYTHAGVIDSSYRGEIKINMENVFADKYLHITAGTKIAQMIIVQHLNWTTEYVDLSELTDTARGDKGFGSTGK